jgi:hypothetical protein
MISIVYFQNVYARPEGGQLNAALAKRSLFALRFKAELR